MNLVREVKSLPYSLLTVFCAFLVVPIFALLFVEAPWTALKSDPWRATLITAAYFVLPPLLSLAALKRSFLLIPVFFLEFTLLILHTLMSSQLSLADMQLVRYLLLGVMIAFSIIFFNKDMLYPMLVGNQRAWRSSPRIALNVPVMLWYHDDPNARLGVTVEDCSLTGISLLGDVATLSKFLRDKEKLTHFILHVGTEKYDWMLNVKVVHIKSDGNQLRAGIMILNREVMRQMLGVLARQGTFKVSWLARYWAREGFHHAALLACAAAVAVVLINPSCSSKQVSQENKRPSVGFWVPEE